MWYRGSHNDCHVVNSYKPTMFESKHYVPLRSLLTFLSCLQKSINMPVNLVCTYYSDTKQKSHCKLKKSSVAGNLTHSRFVIVVNTSEHLKSYFHNRSCFRESFVRCQILFWFN